MFTHIDKNLLIAAMESAIYHACVNANVVSLHAIETGVSALRQRFDQNPESVTDDDVFGMVDTIERAAIPPLATIDAIDNDTSIIDRVVSYLWKNIVDKPSTFPPSAHPHVKADISDFPATMTPTAHGHVKTDISDFPATMTPTAHQHVKADISDFPATIPAAAHQHVKADISDFPATIPAAAHQHVKADISDFPATIPAAAHQHVKADVSDFPATMPPTAHAHVKADVSDFPATLPGRIEVVTWAGNDAATRVISLSGAFVPRYALIDVLTYGPLHLAVDGYYLSLISNTAVTVHGHNSSPYTFRMILIG